MKSIIIIFSYLTLFCVGLMENSRGAFYIDFVDLFNVTSSSGSLLFSISSLASFLATISSRFWLFRFTSVTSTRLGLLFLLTASIAFYFVTAKLNSFYLFMGFNILYGLAIGVLSITLNNLVCENTSLDKRSRVLSGLHSMYGLSSLIAPYILTALYSFKVDWFFAFIILAAFAFIVLGYSFFIRSKPEASSLDTYSFAPFSLYLLVGLAGSLYVSSEVIISSRLSYYLVNSYDLTKVQANYLLSLFFLFLFVGRLLGSIAKINKPKFKLLKISLIASIATLVLGINLYPPLVALSALTMSYYFPYYMGFISESFEKYQKDLIAKLMNFIGGLLFISHWLFGVITDTYGLYFSMYIPIIFLLIALYILHGPLTKHIK